MLYLFDFDGTLVFSYLDRPDKDYHQVEVLRDRPEQLAPLVAAGHTVGIVTNQPAVARGVATEADWTRKLATALAVLGLPADTPVAVCFADARAQDPRYRDPATWARCKPAGAMINELMGRRRRGRGSVSVVV
jgi:D-glycero-D-manno-heptose 1,7-bisphosphate phosphatase